MWPKREKRQLVIGLEHGRQADRNTVGNTAVNQSIGREGKGHKASEARITGKIDTKWVIRGRIWMEERKDTQISREIATETTKTGEQRIWNKENLQVSRPVSPFPSNSFPSTICLTRLGCESVVHCKLEPTHNDAITSIHGEVVKSQAHILWVTGSSPHRKFVFCKLFNRSFCR